MLRVLTFHTPSLCLLATSTVREVAGSIDPLDVATKARDVMQKAETALGEKEEKQD